ncbi:MAG: hypothetical protein LBH22_04485, partial [Bacteroidales bacterium]|nr:hypothetical protein [Bacteroidales bacterium]
MFVYFYRAEKKYYQSLSANDFRRYNSQGVIESLIISTHIRFVLGIESGKSSARLGCDWIDFLYEAVNDAICGYNWNTYNWALSILSFYCHQEERFNKLLTKYEEYLSQASDENRQTGIDFYNE